MEQTLGRLQVVRKTGAEPFRDGPTTLDFGLLAFWQWSVSDLVSNATRGVLAEYIVAKAIGMSDDSIRDQWQAFDLETQSGVKVEVKSAAYCQSWEQREHSAIEFGIRPSRAWDTTTNRFSDERKRQADVYVFCLLKHKDKRTIDPMRLEQWDFYVLPTSVLNEKVPDQKKISLSVLLKLDPAKVKYGEIERTIEQLVLR